MERSVQLNIKNDIVAGVFQDGCYPSTDNKSGSYYSDEASTVSNNNVSSMPDLNDRAAGERSLDEKLMTSLDDEEESEYNSTDNNDAIYADSVPDESVHTQDDDESMSSNSTNEADQNIDVLNQSDVKNNINLLDNDGTTKSVRQFIKIATLQQSCQKPKYRWKRIDEEQSTYPI